MHQPLYIGILGGIAFIVWCLVFRCIGGYTFHQRTAFEARWNKESPHLPGFNARIPAKDTPMTISSGENKDADSNVSDRNRSKQANSRKHKSFFDDLRHEIFNFSRDLTPCFILIITSLLVYLLNKQNYPNAPKYADPVMALFTIVFLMVSSIPMFKRATHILLQSLPEELDNVDGLCQGLKDTFSHQIINIHEVHVWCLVPNKIYATLHIVFKDEDSYLTTISAINALLLTYGINNATIQPEFLDMNNQSNDREESLSNPICNNRSFENRIHEHEKNNETNIELTVIDTLLNNSSCHLPCHDDSCLKKRCCTPRKYIPDER